MVTVRFPVSLLSTIDFLVVRFSKQKIQESTLGSLVLSS